MILAILLHTPSWVYALFALLVWLGVRRLKSRDQALHGLWPVPALFIGWGLYGLFGHAQDIASIGAAWLAGAAFGTIGGSWLEPRAEIDWTRQRAWLPGSAVPLLRNVALFAAHYLLQVSLALATTSTVLLARADAAISGLAAGWFAAWCVRILVTRRGARTLAVPT